MSLSMVFGQTDHVQAFLGQQVGGLVGAVAAQAKQAVQLHFLVVFLHGGHLVHLILPDDTHQLEGGAFGAQNGAAHGQNAGKLLRLHLPPLTVDQTGVAVGDANDLHIIAHALIQRLCHAANGGVRGRGSRRRSKEYQCVFSSFQFLPHSPADPPGAAFGCRRKPHTFSFFRVSPFLVVCQSFLPKKDCKKIEKKSLTFSRSVL